MDQISKHSRLFSIIAIILSIFGYSFLIYNGHKLEKDIIKKKQEINNLEQTRLEKIEEIHKYEEILSDSVSEKNTVSDIIVELPKPKYIIVNTKNQSRAKKYESLGFENLSNRDVELAIANFDNSEQSCNGYNSVFEISRLLKKNKDKLIDANSDYWNVIYKKILSDYSWKLSDENIQLIQNSFTPIYQTKD